MRPEPLRPEAEELVGQRSRGRRDHEQLECRPADPLEHVHPGRQERAALPERCAHQRHPGYARVGADQPGRRKHEVADEAADEDREQRLGKRESRDEDRAGDDHEQRHAEVPPEEPGLEPAEHLEPGRDGLDAPAALDGLPIRHQAR